MQQFQAYICEAAGNKSGQQCNELCESKSLEDKILQLCICMVQLEKAGLCSPHAPVMHVSQQQDAIATMTVCSIVANRYVLCRVRTQ